MFSTPARYFEMDWELVGEIENKKKLFSDGITIFVDAEGIIEV